MEKRVFDIDAGAEVSARRYVYNGNSVIVELDSTGASIVRSYVWGVDVKGSLYRTNGVGGLLSMTNFSGSVPTGTYFPTYDGNGNVASLVNGSTGAFAAVYEYDPFGCPLRGEVFDSAIADQSYRHATRSLDIETSLYYYGRRFYSPRMGRWISRDPIGEAGGINLYAFSLNRPSGIVDYLGMDPTEVWDLTGEMLPPMRVTATRISFTPVPISLHLDPGYASMLTVSLISFSSSSTNSPGQYSGLTLNTDGLGNPTGSGPNSGGVGSWVRQGSGPYIDIVNDAVVGTFSALFKGAQYARAAMGGDWQAFNHGLPDDEVTSAINNGIQPAARNGWYDPSLGINRGVYLAGSFGLIFLDPMAGAGSVESRTFQFADRAWFEDRNAYRALKADIQQNGLKNTLIEFTEIAGQKYVLRGNGRLAVAEDLKFAYKLQFKQVSLPFLSYRTEADVLEEANNIIFNMARGGK